MSERRPKTIEPRGWALRDRGIIPVNKTRARAMRLEPNANCGGIYVIGLRCPPRIFAVRFISAAISSISRVIA